MIRRDDPEQIGFQHTHSEDKETGESVEAAAEIFRNATADRPFYAQVGFTEVHTPFEQGTYREDGVYVPPYLEDTEDVREELAAFQAEINYLDDQVGEILDALEEAGHRERTVVIFAADHGIPFSGAKTWCRRAGLETALVMDGPGSAFSERDTVKPITSSVDVFPTLGDVLDIPVPRQVQGVSFHGFLTGEVNSPPRNAAFSQFTGAGSEARGVITDRYNLVRNFGASRTVEFPVSGGTQRNESTTLEPRPYAQLYDHRDDPFELTDVAEGNEEAVKELSGRLLEWMIDVEDPILWGGITYPYHERALEDLLTTWS